MIYRSLAALAAALLLYALPGQSLAEERKSCTDPVTGMEFVFIPAGSFYTGLTGREINRIDPYDRSEHSLPTTRITFERGFWLGKYEVTRSQWTAVMGDGTGYELVMKDGSGSRIKKPEEKGLWARGGWRDADHQHFFNKGRLPTPEESANFPACAVSWEDVKVFIKKLNELTGKKYRLPSEVEWEYAAKGGQDHVYAGTSDTEKLGDYAWLEINRENKPKSPSGVGGKLPNPFGLYDMSGNVREWVEDDYCTFKPYVENYELASAMSRGGPWVEQPRAKMRVARGGCSTSVGRDEIYRLRTDQRSELHPTQVLLGLGFRLALDP